MHSKKSIWIAERLKSKKMAHWWWQFGGSERVMVIRLAFDTLQIPYVSDVSEYQFNL